MQIDNEVLSVLERCRTQGNALTIPDQLDRELYLRVNKVLNAVGFTWTRKAKAHLTSAPEGAEGALDAVLLTGEIVLPETFNFFPTPLAVIEQMADLAEWEPGQTVLEPSSGDGAIAKYLAALGCNVRCIEIQPQKAAITAGMGLPTSCGDFITVEPGDALVDHIAMNPPFKKRQEAQHVLHALRFLRPGGRLTTVMSAGIEYREDPLYAEVRHLARKRGSIERLPPRSFKTSGTDVNTCLVTINAEGFAPPRAYEKALAAARQRAADSAGRVVETRPARPAIAAATADEFCLTYSD